MTQERPPWVIHDVAGLSRYVPEGADSLLRHGIDRLSLAGEVDGRTAVARAVYDLLLEHEISYDLDAYHPSERVQRIRTPAEVLAPPARGTCLDLAVLYAGLLADHDLLPVVAVLEGHALVLFDRAHELRNLDAYRDEEMERFRYQVVTDHNLVCRLLDTGRLGSVECTGFARADPAAKGSPAPALDDRSEGYLCFEQALDVGGRTIRECAARFKGAFDVAHQRRDLYQTPLLWDRNPVVRSSRPEAALVVDHPTAIHKAKRRHRYRIGLQVPFLGPGATHPADPENLLRCLEGDSELGVLLMGAAGAGKTRTCLRTAEIAHEAGWRVFHVPANSTITNADLETWVWQASPTARTLFVLDYLDACGKLDLQEFKANVAGEITDRGGRLAVLATCRPSQGARLRARGAWDDVLDIVKLRDDDDYLRDLSVHIVRGVAPKSWAERRPALTEICGSNPVIALLIAQDVEQSAGGWPTTRPGSGRRELVRWLEERLRQDGLLPVPADDQAAGGQSRPPHPVLLGCALAAALCPLPRALVECLVQALLDGSPVVDQVPAKPARELVDLLLGMDWLGDVADRLEVTHDIVTDQLLLEAVAPPAALRADDLVLTRMLDALEEHPTALGRFAGNLARVHADLTNEKVATQVDRVCAEWIREHAEGLGHRLAVATDGGEVLTTLLNAAPWQAHVSANWDAVVQPWLDDRFDADDRAELIAFALANQPDELMAPAVSAALVWLARHHEDAAAEEVVSRLLRRKLSSEDRTKAARYALSWLTEHMSTSDRSFILRGLLAHPTGGTDLDRRAIEAALNWLKSNPHASAGDYVLGPLLRHPALESGMARRSTDSAVAWLTHHSGRAAASYVFKPLLRRPELRSSSLRRIVDLADVWLTQYVSLDEASHVLGPLASRLGPRLGNHPNIVAHAVSWLEAHGDAEDASFVLRAVLHSGGLPSREARQCAALALGWVKERFDERSNHVLPALVRVAESDLDPAVTSEIIDLALKWLHEDPHRPGSGYVLAGLIESPRIRDHQLDVVTDIGLAWLERNADQDDASYVFVALLTRAQVGADATDRIARAAGPWLGRGLWYEGAGHVLQALLDNELVDRRHVDVAVADAHRWLDAHSGAPGTPLVIAALLGRAVPSDRLPESLDRVKAWLARNSGEPAASHVLRALLKRDDLDPPTRRRAERLGLSWLEEHPDDPGISHVLCTLLTDRFAASETSRKALELAIHHTSDHPATAGTPFILEALLLHPGLDHDRRDQIARGALDWARENQDAPGTGRVLQALLTTRTTTPPELGVDGVGEPVDDVGDGAAEEGADGDLLDDVAAEDVAARCDVLNDAVLVALVWLRARPEHVSTPFLLQALLQNPGIPSSHVVAAAGEALQWVRDHPDAPASAWVLAALLPHSDLRVPDRVLAEAAERAMTWVEKSPESAGASRVLLPLMGNRRLPSAQRQRAAELAKAWLSDHGGARGAPAVHLALIEREAPSERTSSTSGATASTEGARESALAWMKARPQHPGVDSVLCRLLTDDDEGIVAQAAEFAPTWLQDQSYRGRTSYVLTELIRHRSLVPDIVPIVREWLDRHGDSASASYVVHALIDRTTGIEEGPEIALAWAADRPHHHSAPTVLERLHRETDTDLLIRAADLALATLEQDLDDDPLSRLLAGLVWNSSLEAGRLARGAALAMDWLRTRIHLYAAGRVLQPLLRNPNVPTPDGASAVPIAVEWGRRHINRVGASYLISALLNSPHADARVRESAIDLGVDWRARHLDHPRGDYLLRATTDAAAVSAMAWLRSHPDSSSASSVLDQAVVCIEPTDAVVASAATTTALAWVAQHPEAPSTPVLLRHLIHYTVDAEAFTAVGQEVLQWVADRPEHPDLLRSMVGNTRAPAEAIVPAVAAVVAWTDDHPEDPRVPALLRAAIGGTRVPSEVVGAPAAAAIAWMERHPGDPENHALFRTLIHKIGFDEAQLERCTALMVSWLSEHLDSAEGVDLLRYMCVQYRCLPPSHLRRAVAGAADHLTADADGEKSAELLTVLREMQVPPDVLGPELTRRLGREVPALAGAGQGRSDTGSRGAWPSPAAEKLVGRAWLAIRSTPGRLRRFRRTV